MKTKILSKPCRLCHKVKSLVKFSRDAGYKLGIKTYCKLCEKGLNKKYYQKRKRNLKGFNWQDVSKGLTLTAEDEFDSLYGNSDVRIKGKLVMRKGNIIDEKWYQKKLAQIKKGRNT